MRRPRPADVVRADGARDRARSRRSGVTALVECTPVGVGRRADLDRAVSEATGFPIVVPTGIYREPWIPAWALEASEDEIARLDARRAGGRDRGQRAFAPAGSSSAPATTASRRSRRRFSAPRRAPGGRPARSSAATPSAAAWSWTSSTIIEAAGYTAGALHLDPHPGRAGLRRCISRRPARRVDRVRLDRRDDRRRDLHRQHPPRARRRPRRPAAAQPRPRLVRSGQARRRHAEALHLSHREVFLPKLRDSGVDAATIAMLTRTTRSAPSRGRPRTHRHAARRSTLRTIIPEAARAW